MASIKTGRTSLPHFTLLYGVDGVGKCLGRGTSVILSDGSLRAVETIKPGDVLMGPDSKPRRVLSVTKGSGPLYRVRPNKGEAFICNDVHLLTISKNGGAWEEIEARKYAKLPANKRRYLSGVRVAVEFPEQDLSVDPYFAGIWIGDGTLRSTSIRVSKPDDEIHAAVEEFASSNGLRTNLANVTEGACPTVAVTGYKRGESPRKIPDELRTGMEELGWGSDEKTIPDKYLRASRKQRLALLAGLLDSDGHLIHNCFEISTKFKALAGKIVFLARSLGFQATCRTKKSRIKELDFSGEYERIFISGNTAEIPTRIKRKQASVRQQSKNPLRFGMEVTSIGEGEYFGFTLDGDRRFLLGDFTVTHNTTFAAEAPSPVFIGPELGFGQLDVARFPAPKNYQEVLATIQLLTNETHDYKTLAIDSLDWIEPLVFRHICEKHGWQSLEDPGYGKGYAHLVPAWAEMVTLLKKLRAKMNVVLIAHASIRTFNDPENNAAYNRHQLKLFSSEKADTAALWREAVDDVLFANFEISTTQGKNDRKAKAFGDGSRVIYTERRPAFDAKNRFSLPFRLPLSWEDYAAACKASSGSAPSEDDIKALAEAVKGHEEQAAAWLVEKGWLESGKPLASLPQKRIRRILDNVEGFIKTITPTPPQD